MEEQIKKWQNKIDQVNQQVINLQFQQQEEINLYKSKLQEKQEEINEITKIIYNSQQDFKNFQSIQFNNKSKQMFNSNRQMQSDFFESQNQILEKVQEEAESELKLDNKQYSSLNQISEFLFQQQMFQQQLKEELEKKDQIINNLQMQNDKSQLQKQNNDMVENENYDNKQLIESTNINEHGFVGYNDFLNENYKKNYEQNQQQINEIQENQYLNQEQKLKNQQEEIERIIKDLMRKIEERNTLLNQLQNGRSNWNYLEQEEQNKNIQKQQGIDFNLLGNEQTDLLLLQIHGISQQKYQLQQQYDTLQKEQYRIQNQLKVQDKAYLDSIVILKSLEEQLIQKDEIIEEKEQQINKMIQEIKDIKHQINLREEEIQDEKERLLKEQDKLEGIYQQKQIEQIQNLQRDTSIMIANLEFEIRQTKFKSDDFKNKYLQLKEQGMGDQQQTILLLQNQCHDYQQQLQENVNIIDQAQTQNALLRDQIIKLLSQDQHQNIAMDQSIFDLLQHQKEISILKISASQNSITDQQHKLLLQQMDQLKIQNQKLTNELKMINCSAQELEDENTQLNHQLRTKLIELEKIKLNYEMEIQQFKQQQNYQSIPNSNDRNQNIITSIPPALKQYNQKNMKSNQQKQSNNSSANSLKQRFNNPLLFLKNDSHISINDPLSEALKNNYPFNEEDHQQIQYSEQQEQEHNQNTFNSNKSQLTQFNNIDTINNKYKQNFNEINEQDEISFLSDQSKECFINKSIQRNLPLPNRNTVQVSNFDGQDLNIDSHQNNIINNNQPSDFKKSNSDFNNNCSKNNSINKKHYFEVDNFIAVSENQLSNNSYKFQDGESYDQLN